VQSATWLDDLLSESPPRRRAAVDQLRVRWPSAAGGAPRILDALATAAHLEILADEVPNVLRDALEQGREWGTAGQVQESTGSWFDALVASWAADLLARNGPAGKLEDLAIFFHERYRVGAETPGRDVPATILAGLGARALLITKGMVAHAATEAPAFVRAALGTVGAAVSVLAWAVLASVGAARVRPLRITLRTASWTILAMAVAAFLVGVRALDVSDAVRMGARLVFGAAAVAAVVDLVLVVTGRRRSQRAMREIRVVGRVR
jgi:hypothetical protein